MSYLGHTESNASDTSAAYDRMNNKRLVIYTTSKQGKFCKGKCDRIAEYPKGRNKYLNNAYCSRCSNWLKLTDLIPHPSKGVLCPCCNFRPRTKNFKQNTKAKAKT